MRDREPLGLKSLAVLTLLDRLSGHSRSLDERPTSSRRRHSMPTPSSPTHGRKISNYQPPPPLLPHPPPHTHCITPPLIETDTSEQPRFDEQPQSKLLQLPEEILLLIYEQVIGNQVLHIVRRHHKLCHTSCLTNGDTDACKEAQCRGFKLPNGLYAEGSGSEDLIPLLQVCRKIYVDAIKVLYASNIFSLDSLESVVCVSTTILPQRFDSIQSLQLDFCFSLSFYFSESNPCNDSPRWLRVWAIIGCMKALHNLWVRISWPYPKLGAVQEKRLMEPLWMAAKLRTYEVSLPPAYGGKEVDWGDAPFKVIRRVS